MIDSSGLKVYDEEWILTKKGKKYARKVWRKIHIGIDGKGHIKASKMTSHKTDDRACFPDLIDKALADSGYDSHNSYHQYPQRHIHTIIPPPKNARISCTRKNAFEERNKTINYINEKGIHAWKTKNDYGRRNRVENTFYRLKTIFGRQFLSRTWKRQEVELPLLCNILNRMTLLGMPTSVKVG